MQNCVVRSAVAERTHRVQPCTQRLPKHLIYLGKHDEHMIGFAPKWREDIFFFVTADRRVTKHQHFGTFVNLVRLSDNRFAIIYRRKFIVYQLTHDLKIIETERVETWTCTITPFNDNFIVYTTKPEGIRIVGPTLGLEKPFALNKTGPAHEIEKVGVSESFHIVTSHGGCKYLKIWKFTPSVKHVSLISKIDRTSPRPRHTLGSKSYVVFDTLLVDLSSNTILNSEYKFQTFVTPNAYIVNDGSTIMLLDRDMKILWKNMVQHVDPGTLIYGRNSGKIACVVSMYKAERVKEFKVVKIWSTGHDEYQLDMLRNTKFVDMVIKQ
jgi:hypothetical protein